MLGKLVMYTPTVLVLGGLITGAVVFGFMKRKVTKLLS